MKIKYDNPVAIATVVAAVMSPVILAGILFRPIKLYFDAGMDIADKIGELIVNYLDKDA